ncbi:N-terminal Xaa-Pro-Lys N-methyltransferase 1 isoform X2 [Amia ocellicauda]|uniref:N-terminal Xaa-Pro-Lys N-methyltransferase 1 isoform X2 n=1 Tax=Amia ocellicauda TaxID=2972642 RepID=UPI0034642B22
MRTALPGRLGGGAPVHAVSWRRSHVRSCVRVRRRSVRAGLAQRRGSMGDVVEDESTFYSKAERYWQEVPPTVDGMLGGYGSISNIDINGSRRFLKRYLGEGPDKTGTNCALDCGAGIGRITKRLLLPLFRTVDMVDVTSEFLDKARSFLGEDGRRVDNYYCCGLQDFQPQPGRYDVIWIQWVIDEHLVSFLRRCRVGLRPGGLVVVKDNVAHEGVVLDEVDSSVCRDLPTLRSLVQRAGLEVLQEEKQENFPDEIYQVQTLALR